MTFTMCQAFHQTHPKSISPHPRLPSLQRCSPQPPRRRKGSDVASAVAAMPRSPGGAHLRHTHTHTHTHTITNTNTNTNTILPHPRPLTPLPTSPRASTPAAEAAAATAEVPPAASSSRLASHPSPSTSHALSRPLSGKLLKRGQKAWLMTLLKPEHRRYRDQARESARPLSGRIPGGAVPRRARSPNLRTGELR